MRDDARARVRAARAAAAVLDLDAASRDLP